MTLPLPAPNADSAAYWTGAKAGKLMLQRCRACGTTWFLSRHLCGSCWSDRIEPVEASGRGQVHSFTVIHRAPSAAFAGQVPWLLAVASATLSGAACWFDVETWTATGLAPTNSGQGATVFAMIALQGGVVFVGAIMALYLGLRSGRGLLRPPVNTTMDIVSRFLGFAALQGLGFAVLTRLAPGLAG